MNVHMRPFHNYAILSYKNRHEILPADQVLWKSMFCVDLAWNDPILILLANTDYKIILFF